MTLPIANSGVLRCEFVPSGAVGFRTRLEDSLALKQLSPRFDPQNFMAKTTHPASLWTPVGVLFRELMAALAMRLFGQSRRNGVTAQCVQFDSRWLNMVRVYARPMDAGRATQTKIVAVVAEVINRVSIWNRAFKKFVRNAMGFLILSADAEDPIAIRVNICGPKPASGVWLWRNFRQKPGNESRIDHGHVTTSRGLVLSGGSLVTACHTNHSKGGQVKAVLEILKNRAEHPFDRHESLDQLGIDSLELLDVLVDIEAETGVKISPDELRRMTTVQDLCNYVEANAALVSD